MRRFTNTNAKHGQLALYATLLVVAVALMAALRHCSGGNATADRPTASGGDTIDVAIEYSPATCYTFDDTLGGFDYDLLRLLAAQHGTPLKFHTIVTLRRGLDGLADGTYRLLVAQFPVTAQQRQHYIFTEPVYIDQQVLVQRSGLNTIDSQLLLAGDTVHVVAGSPMASRIEGLSREIGDTIHVVAEPLYGPEQLTMMVAAGEIKYAVVNRRIARQMAQRIGGIDCSLEISLSQFQAWALAPRDIALRDSLNIWLNDAVSTDEYKELHRRYFD